MNNVRTVSDTKRAFYTHHTRPINSVYRRVVEELMVEMHLLSVNIDFRYDPIYALGVVSCFDKFMQGYTPERDKDSIFKALTQALGEDCQKYRQDAQRLQVVANQLAGQDLVAALSQKEFVDGAVDLREIISGIANNPRFKYSRLLAIGLFTLLELAEPEFVKDEKQLLETFKQISEVLNLSVDKIQKDLELYRSNLEKMLQARIVLEDTMQAERKKRQQRDNEKDAVAHSASDVTESTPMSDPAQEQDP